MRDDKIVHSATRHVIIIMIEKNGVCFRKKNAFFLSNGIGRFEGDKKKQLAQ